MARLARETPWACKLSGLLTECGPAPRPDAARRWARHVLDHFGPTRVVWGSDWPVLQLASDYTPWWQETQALLANQQPGMVRPPTGEGGGEGIDLCLVADQHVAAQMRAATSSTLPAASMARHRSGSAAGSQAKKALMRAWNGLPIAS